MSTKQQSCRSAHAEPVSAVLRLTVPKKLAVHSCTPKSRTVADMGTPHSPAKITVDEYYEMARVGLIDGEIVAMAPIGNPHAYVVDVLKTDSWRSCAAARTSECRVHYA